MSIFVSYEHLYKYVSNLWKYTSLHSNERNTLFEHRHIVSNTRNQKRFNLFGRAGHLRRADDHPGHCHAARWSSWSSSRREHIVLVTAILRPSCSRSTLTSPLESRWRKAVKRNSNQNMMQDYKFREASYIWRSLREGLVLPSWWSRCNKL